MRGNYLLLLQEGGGRRKIAVGKIVCEGQVEGEEGKGGGGIGGRENDWSMRSEVKKTLLA